MSPVLYQEGLLEIRAYGLMLALSFLAGAVLAWHRARLAGLDQRAVLHLTIPIVIAAVLGSRLLFVAVNYDSSRDDLLAVLQPLSNGTVALHGAAMNGGILLAIAAIWGFTRLRRLPLLTTLDVVAPCLFLGIFLTRIGCFLNGCCAGTPTGVAWGVSFPNNPVAVHPTQLYSSACGVALFAVAVLCERRYKRYEGFTTAVVLLLYGLARFTIEFFRSHDGETVVAFGLTHNQIFSVVVFVAALVFLLSASALRDHPSWAERSFLRRAASPGRLQDMKGTPQ